MEKPYLLNNYKLDEFALKKVFLHNLNELYPVLLHLAESLPNLAQATCFGDLQNIIEQLSMEVNNQIIITYDIYTQLKEIPADPQNFADECIIQAKIPVFADELMDNLSKDLLIIFFLQKIIAVKRSYFYILKSIANCLHSTNIKEYLQYCFNECEDNIKLFQLVAKEYAESNINNFLK